jgi:hypothetical protein
MLLLLSLADHIVKFILNLPTLYTKYFEAVSSLTLHYAELSLRRIVKACINYPGRQVRMVRYFYH